MAHFWPIEFVQEPPILFNDAAHVLGTWTLIRAVQALGSTCSIKRFWQLESKQKYNLNVTSHPLRVSLKCLPVIWHQMNSIMVHCSQINGFTKFQSSSNSTIANFMSLVYYYKRGNHCLASLSAKPQHTTTWRLWDSNWDDWVCYASFSSDTSLYPASSCSILHEKEEEEENSNKLDKDCPQPHTSTRVSPSYRCCEEPPQECKLPEKILAKLAQAWRVSNASWSLYSLCIQVHLTLWPCERLTFSTSRRPSLACHFPLFSTSPCPQKVTFESIRFSDVSTEEFHHSGSLIRIVQV